MILEFNQAARKGNSKPLLCDPAASNSQHPTRSTSVGTGFSLSPSAAAQRLFEGAGSQRNARFSPDAKYIAYLSTPGQGGDIAELYVQPFPKGPRVQVSTNGAEGSAWGPGGKQIFFKQSNGLSPLMAVSIQTAGSEIRVGQPETLFDFDGTIGGVTPDGMRFLMLRSACPEDRVSRFNLVLNWFD